MKIIDKHAVYSQYAEKIVNYDVKKVSPHVISMDQAILSFVDKAEQQHIPLSLKMIQRKALQEASKLNLPDFKASKGWLRGFVNRQKLKSVKLHGEASSVNMMDVKNWLIDNIDILMKYRKDDIFNCDETAFFPKSAREKSYVYYDSKKTYHGVKRNKCRLTIMLTSNLTGEKEVPLVNGHHAKPRCFKSISYDLNHLPVIYKHDNEAWMTRNIFREWLRNWDKKLLEIDREILLLCDNFSGQHNLGESFINIKILFFPPKVTSVLQPMDAGIIGSFKNIYSDLYQDYLLDSVESLANGEEYDLLKMISNIKLAWDKVTPETIQNCWRHTSITAYYDCANSQCQIDE